MENDLKGIENYLELTRGSSYRGCMLQGVDCSPQQGRGQLNAFNACKNAELGLR